MIKLGLLECFIVKKNLKECVVKGIIIYDNFSMGNIEKL